MSGDGWYEVPLGDLVEKVAVPVEVDPKKSYREIGIRSHGKGLFDKEPVTGETLGDKRVFWVQPDCLVINIVFAWEMAVARTTASDVGKIASHRFPMFKPRPGKADVEFLTYFFKTPYGKHLLTLASPGGAGRNKTLGQDNFLQSIVRVPSLAVQTKIAKVLSTWDASISVVDDLVDKSRLQSIALTQRLMTGKVRFGEFRSLDWRDVQLSEIAEVIVSNVDKKANADESIVRLCNYTDVYHRDLIADDIDFMEATASAEEIEKFSLRKNDVIITKDSETPDDIAVPAFVCEELTKVLCGYHLAIVRPDTTQVDGEFLSQLFSLKTVQHHFFTRANGATRFGLTIDGIREVSFRIPPIDEQIRIAKVIRSSKRDVQNFRQQLDRLRTEKTSLMQQLLTGRRRVATRERAA